MVTKTILIMLLLFAKLVFIDNIELGIRAEYIEVLLTYKPLVP